MNDLTPDVIAAIATGLYNEIPGMSHMPKSETAVAEMPNHAMELPGIAASPPTEMSALPLSSPPSPGSSFMTAPEVSSSPDDGLKSFVQRVRLAGISSEPTIGSPGLDGDFAQRLFKSDAPAGGSPFGGSPAWHVPTIRNDFPILDQQVHGKQLVWFDNAATTQKPQSVIDAVSNFYSHDNSNIHRGAHTLAARATDAYEQARQKVQTFLGAGSAKEIVFVRGTTEGINLVAQTYGRKFLQPGDEIVLSTLEHHANIVPWQMVAKEKGAVLRVIPVTDRGEVMLEEYQALLGPKTRIVSLAHASNALGTILPVAEMTQMAKRYNARVLIDGAQSIAHLPVNVQQLGCDYYVFSGHKIFAPTGIGAVFAKEELLEIMPPWQGGGSMIRNVTFEETTYSEPPAKFEAGTPNIGDAVGLGAALDYVNRLGLANIARHEHELLEYATGQLSAIKGLRIIGTAREKVAVISFVLQNRRTEDVGRMLDQAGIAVRSGHHCAQPTMRRFGVESTVRPSFSLYNTVDEIDRLVDAVRRIQYS
jgi:cysteine desulfurase/selenocysteine lyase